MSDTIKIYINQTQPVKAITVAPTGATGPGVPTGGATNDILKKTNSTNYDTTWETPTSTATASTIVRRDASGGAAFDDLTSTGLVVLGNVIIGSIDTLLTSRQLLMHGEGSVIANPYQNSQIYNGSNDSPIYTAGANSPIYTINSTSDIYTQHATSSVKSYNFAAYDATVGAALRDSAGAAYLTWGATAGNISITVDTTSTGHFLSNPGTATAGHFITKNGTAPTIIAGRSAWFSNGSGDPQFKNGTSAAVTIATLEGSETLTNKTLTSPSINSATFGTAATFNATSYTYGAGAATEHMASIVSGSGIGNVFCYDDFVGTSATGGGIGELGWTGGTTVAIRGNESGHPGIIRVSATATGSLFLNYLAGAGNPDSFNGLTIEGVFRIGAITNCRHIFGVGYVNAYLTNGFRGITFDPANSANWRLHHRTSAGVDTFTDTGKAAVANDWVRVKLTFASGLTTCTIATTTSATDATVTNSGAYTVGSAAHTPQWIFQSTSGTQTLDVDAFMMHGKTTRL